VLTRASKAEEVLAALYWYFDERCQPGEWEDEHIYHIRDILGESRCKVHVEPLEPPCEQYVYAIYLFLPPKNLPFASSTPFSKAIKDAFRHLVFETVVLHLDVRVKALLPQEPQSVGLNNCYFKKEKTILHDELRFRSRGEIAIYEEMKKRDVLFFPNAAAVLGCSASEYGQGIEKKEPDFLICYKGKWGILEINGDEFHSGLVKTTKDHERARRFNHYGVFFIQAFDADKCKADPEGVVDEFLMLLERHK